VDHAIRCGGSSSSTSHRTTPSNPGAGSVRNVKWWPTAGWKSLGISQAASASLDVSAARTRSTGCGQTAEASMSAFISFTYTSMVGAAGTVPGSRAWQNRCDSAGHERLGLR
jgi:hypothetical protein